MSSAKNGFPQFLCGAVAGGALIGAIFGLWMRARKGALQSSSSTGKLFRGDCDDQKAAPKGALVTGASSGIGRAVCVEMAKRGYSVVIHFGSNQAGASETKDQCMAVRVSNDQVFPIIGCRFTPSLSLDTGAAKGSKSDASSCADLDCLVQSSDGLIRSQSKGQQKLDILINNAGLYEEVDMLSSGKEDWDGVLARSLAVNLAAPLALSRQFAKLVQSRHRDTELKRGGIAATASGSIVNVASRGAYRGEPNAVAYGAHKAALISATQSLAQRLGGLGVVVTAVAPGFVATPMAAGVLADPARGPAVKAQSSWGRVARPGEVAAAVEFLASGRAPFATGTVIDVNGASYLR